MSKIRYIAAAMTALGALVATSSQAQAQETDPPGSEATSPNATLEGASITLRVDGMSCPFCAYGLEKRLKAIESVDEVLIRVSDGLVQIRAKENSRITDDELRKAVDRAGFSLREIHRVDG
jgi:copper chaperone CopZ